MRSRLLTLAALLLGGCSSVSVKTDSDPSADYGRYRTFAFMPVPDSEASLRGSLAEQRIQAAVRRELGEKGITEDPAHPDFLVAYHVVLQEKLRAEHWGYGWDPYWGGPTTVSSYTEGTLILDFVDPAQRKVFWRGTGTAIVDEPGSGAKKIDTAVTKMIEKYPPEEKAAMR